MWTISISILGLLHITASCTTPSDLASFVQTAASTAMRQKPSDARGARLSRGSADPCDCLKWTDVYDSKRVICGQGPELFHGVLDQHKTEFAAEDPVMKFLTGPASATYELICNRFFKRLATRRGVNLWFENITEGSWCYVNSTCSSGVLVPGTDVRWKVCDKSRDRSMNDLLPEQVFAVGKQLELNIGVLLGYAYNVLTGHGNPDNPVFNETDEMIPTAGAAVQRASSSIGPVVLQSAHCVKDHCTSRVVVHGSQVWEFSSPNATAYMTDPHGASANWKAVLVQHS